MKRTRKITIKQKETKRFHEVSNKDVSVSEWMAAIDNIIAHTSSIVKASVDDFVVVVAIVFCLITTLESTTRDEK